MSKVVFTYSSDGGLENVGILKKSPLAAVVRYIFISVLLILICILVTYGVVYGVVYGDIWGLLFSNFLFDWLERINCRIKGRVPPCAIKQRWPVFNSFVLEKSTGYLKL